MSVAPGARSPWLLVATLGAAAAFAAASWTRLSVPYSTAEAAFVHQSFRAGSQVISPDFGSPVLAGPARLLGVIQQLVGNDERSLRTTLLALLAAAGFLLLELIAAPRLTTALVPVLALLAVPMTILQGDLVRPELFVLVAGSLALLAAPAVPPVGIARALLGLAGTLAAGVIALHAALVLAVILVGVALLRGSALDRATAIVTAAAGVAMGCVVHGAPAALASLASGPELRLGVFAAIPAAIVLLASAARALGPVAEVPVLLALVAAVSFPFWRTAAPAAPSPIAILDQVRSVALPGAALAVDGPDRVAVAVYARLGHAPGTAIIYMPEHATSDGLAEFCRSLSLRQVFLYPPRAEPPPGFSAVESRPAGAPLLMPLALSTP